MHPVYLALSQLNPDQLALLGAILGLLVGSFLNVVIARLPRMMEADWQRQAAELRGETPPEPPPFNLIKPRSRCPHCQTPIAAYHNVPVLSWLFLRGRCAHCHTRISVRYPLIELLTAGLSAAALARYGWSAAGAGALILTFGLIALAFIDLDTQFLPDDLTLPLLWLGLAFNLTSTFVPLKDAVLGAMAGYGSLWMVFWAFKLATGKDGMGYGDFKLLGALGAWFGWQALPAVVLLSSLAGACVGIALIVFRKHQREVPIPFGPYLACAGIMAMYWGDPLRAFFHAL